MPDLGRPEILILLILALVLFGAKRLPGAARSLGQSLRIFMAETKGLRSDDDTLITPTPGTLPLESPTGSPGTMPISPVPPVVHDQTAPPLQK
jgi:sec-independent protein translocase protein TatA